MLLNPNIRASIKQREQLCIDCPYNSINAVKSGLYTTERTDLHCHYCGCVIKLLVRDLKATCSIKEINQEKNLNLPVKWFPLT